MSDILFKLPEIFEAARRTYLNITGRGETSMGTGAEAGAGSGRGNGVGMQAEPVTGVESAAASGMTGATGEEIVAEVRSEARTDLRLSAGVRTRERAFEIVEAIGDKFTGRAAQRTDLNRIVSGDNIKYMKYLLENGFKGKLDMIYIDPPFYSKADYSVNIKVGTSNRKLILTKSHAFTDKWDDGMAEYLEAMTVRLMLMRDLLADTGSIFLHLDWHCSHYLKIIMDQIFGEKNFVNEIVWNYKSGGVSKRYFARKHDVILFYAKTKQYFFETQKEKSYNRGMKPYRFKGVKEYKDNLGWYTLVSMKDVWQIDMVGRTSSERTGYATQKPEALVRRIMKSATQEGDLCADFFCGSGTLGAVCSKMGRNYIMCDSSEPAVMMAHKRMAQIESAHMLIREKKEISPNFCVRVGVYPVDGVIKTVSICLEGVSYKDIDSLGIEEKNQSLLETIVRNHFVQLVEYWCVDTDYDGVTVRPRAFFCKEKDKMDVTAIFPENQIKRIAVKVIDVFGNEALVLP